MQGDGLNWAGMLEYIWETDPRLVLDVAYLLTLRKAYQMGRYDRLRAHMIVGYALFGHTPLPFHPPPVCFQALVQGDDDCGCNGSCEGGLRRPVLLGQRAPTTDELRDALGRYVGKWGVPDGGKLPPSVFARFLYRAALQRYYTEHGPRASSCFRYVPYGNRLVVARQAAHEYARGVVRDYFHAKGCAPPRSIEGLESSGHYCYYELSGQLEESKNGDLVCPMNNSVLHPPLCDGSCEGGLRLNHALWSADITAQGPLSRRQQRLAEVAKANAESILEKLSE